MRARKRRKTITFDKDVYKALLQYRGRYILKTGKDKTMTKAVNELLRKQLELFKTDRH